MHRLDRPVAPGLYWRDGDRWRPAPAPPGVRVWRSDELVWVKSDAGEGLVPRVAWERYKQQQMERTDAAA